MRTGATLILAATAIAGGSGYIATALVGATSTAQDYAVFGVFWSALYLVIAALSGIQQEVTRATSRVEVDGIAAAGARRFAMLAALAAALVVALSSPLWVGAIDDGAGGPWLVPVIVGAAGYVVVAVVAGVLYGLELWVPIAAMSSVDGVLRLLLIGVAVLTGAGDVWLAWAVVAPFPLTPLLLWPFFRRRVVGRFSLDVRLPALAVNSIRAVGATIATGVMISGFPLVLALTASDEPAARLGAAVLAINLVRAPLVIVVLSLQSFFIVRFRALGPEARSLFRKLALLILAATVLLAAASGVVAPPLLDLIWPQYEISTLLIVGLVVASGLLGVLCLSGPLVLASGRHSRFLAGWGVAALATVLLLLVPAPLEARVLISLLAPPLVGVAVHLVRSPRPRASVA